uniref:Uncharacterized protein n=1 Tax=Candidatus Kentrum sp. SD TaxID=2126332 RepID=A0A450YR72_9GAMM|nr:MAG: hypothetical protein BECKSD772F_GA0070984_11652 [Candidatus Kentron sp. SD]
MALGRNRNFIALLFRPPSCHFNHSPVISTEGRDLWRTEPHQNKKISPFGRDDRRVVERQQGSIRNERTLVERQQRDEISVATRPRYESARNAMV